MSAADEDPVRNHRGEGLLDPHQALQILLFLPPKFTGPLRATSKSSLLAKTGGSDALWAAHARGYFGLSGAPACRGPKGEDCGASWEKAFTLWHGSAPDAAFKALQDAGVEGELRARWIGVWHRIRQWTRREAPHVAATLRPPVDAQSALEKLEGAHPAVLGLWCLHDGQDAPMNRLGNTPWGMRTIGEEEWANGLLGGYTVYDHEVSTVLLPLDSATKLTNFFRQRVQMPNSRLAFACSYNFSKILFVDTADGAVWVWTMQQRSPFQLAVPSSGGLSQGNKVRLHDLKARPELNGQRGCLDEFDKEKERWQVRMEDGSAVHLLKAENLEPERRPLPADGLLRWLEEYAERLDEGIYSVMPLRPAEATATLSTKGICLFPVSGPELSCCVTKGVEVTASAVYMPEHPQNGWTYSIALRLVGTPEERGYKTCQLDVRDWYIQEDGSEPDHVRGEGVVGFFPILDDGGWWLNRESDPNRQYVRPSGFTEGAFRYQSCSGRTPSMRGHFSGDLTFVPGTRKAPTGPAFQAKLAKFRLRVPEYIY